MDAQLKSTPKEKKEKFIYIILGLMLIVPSLIALLSKSHIPRTVQEMIYPFQAHVLQIPIPGAHLSYYTRGSGEPLILLPGFGMTMGDWDPLFLDQLAQHNQLIILDFRGVGSSTGSLELLSQKQITDDVIAFMNKMNIKKANVLGWSMGSFIAQDIAEQHPQYVNKLILIGTGPGGAEQIGAGDSISNTIQKNLAGSWEDVYVPFLFESSQAKQGYLSRLHTARETKEIPTVVPENEEAKFAYERSFSFADEENARYTLLSSIKSPTLIISGANDQLVPAKNAKITGSKIYGSKVVIIPDAGHAVLFEKSDEVTKLIDQFLHPTK